MSYYYYYLLLIIIIIIVVVVVAVAAEVVKNVLFIICNPRIVFQIYLTLKLVASLDILSKPLFTDTKLFLTPYWVNDSTYINKVKEISKRGLCGIHKGNTLKSDREDKGRTEIILLAILFG